jgi:hypothetical protein
MTDANIRIPTDVRDRLAAIAAGEGMPLRTYLARLAGTLLTPPSGRSAPSGPAKCCASGTVTTPRRRRRRVSTPSSTAV